MGGGPAVRPGEAPRQPALLRRPLARGLPRPAPHGLRQDPPRDPAGAGPAPTPAAPPAGDLIRTSEELPAFPAPQEGLLPTHMFGSPPVLSLTTADTATGQSAKLVHDGHEILRELQLPDSAVRWFVADQDLIPRLWNAADPMYAYARRSSALVRVLEWREQVFGGPMLTADKFLYDMRARPAQRPGGLPPTPPSLRFASPPRRAAPLRWRRERTRAPIPRVSPPPPQLGASTGSSGRGTRG